MATTTVGPTTALPVFFQKRQLYGLGSDTSRQGQKLLQLADHRQALTQNHATMLEHMEPMPDDNCDCDCDAESE